MKATIWHNPKCGTSRAVLALLEAEPDLALDVVRYLDDPPTRATLARLFAAAGMAAREGLRVKGTEAEARGLTSADDAIVLDAMAADPALIERPLVETDKGVALCRPAERVRDLL